MEIFNQPYSSLLVWQKADLFAFEVYKVAISFPKGEIYGITSQLRRAVLSVVLNIVEGHSRQSAKEFVRFLYIARASNAECAYLLDFFHRVSYLSDSDFKKLESLRRMSGYFIQKTINSFSGTSFIS